MFHGKALPRLLMLCAFLLAPVPAFAGAQVILSSPNADGVFLLQAADLAGVHGVEVQISYDPLTLANPRVDMGSLASGTLNAANRSNPIKIMMISSNPLKGSGTLATITFDRVGPSAGAITGLSAALSDLYGRRLAMQAMLVPPLVKFSAGDNGSSSQTGSGSVSDSSRQSVAVNPNAPSTTQAGSQTTPGMNSTAPRRYLAGGTVRMSQNDETDIPSNREGSPYQPPEVGGEQQKPEQEGTAPAAPAPETPTAGGESTGGRPAAQPALQPQKIVSVLERFRQFQGEKTLPALVALFQNVGPGVRQTPAIAVSDGRSTVKVVIPKAGDKTPNFTFRGAKFVAVAPTAEGAWEVEVRPEPGSVDAAVIMLTDTLHMEYPLTVAPMAHFLAGKSPEALESEFPSFVKGEGSTPAPEFDLNGDGKRDYIDDYIFTADYLLKVEAREKQKTPSRQ
jgi:hypothetical protein